MRIPRLSFALSIALMLGLTTATSADEPGFKIVVHPKNANASIERDVLRNAFLKKEAVWKGGETMRPIDLSSKSPVRARFTRVVLKKTAAQLKTYWSQQIFSGKGVPPPEVQTPAEVIAYVLANPGAVAYLPSDADPRGAKVIEVK
jgi:ABC-type phosphate transport system substrate-binding protein